MTAFQFLAVKRKHREQHALLGIQALAQSGDGKEITKQLEAWEKDAT